MDDESRLLLQRTELAMKRGIKAIAPGRQINIIGRVIESYARRFGYGVVRDFTGHGIGTAFHSGSDRARTTTPPRTTPRSSSLA